MLASVLLWPSTVRHQAHHSSVRSGYRLDCLTWKVEDGVTNGIGGDIFSVVLVLRMVLLGYFSSDRFWC